MFFLKCIWRKSEGKWISWHATNPIFVRFLSIWQEKECMPEPGFEPGTSCMWSQRANHSATATTYRKWEILKCHFTLFTKLQTQFLSEMKYATFNFKYFKIHFGIRINKVFQYLLFINYFLHLEHPVDTQSISRKMPKHRNLAK